MVESRRRQRGGLSVEAAYVLPVIIVAGMMFMELANIGLTINLGASALERAVQQFRQDGVTEMIDGGDLSARLRRRMAAASHGYLDEDNIVDVDVESFATLDAMGGGKAGSEDGAGDESEDNKIGADTGVPAWRITVGIRKDFITPLPRLLGVDSSAFRYQYQQVLSYLPRDQRDEDGR